MESKYAHRVPEWVEIESRDFMLAEVDISSQETTVAYWKKKLSEKLEAFIIKYDQTQLNPLPTEYSVQTKIQ